MRGSGDAGYFHVCTDGAALEWMFQDDRDFIAGINRIAICVLKTGVAVLAFVLMDNHVHFLLYGTMPQCKSFINLYKRLTGTWIRNKYGISDHLRHLPTEILRIDTEERLLNTIAYIDRNAVMAGYNCLPGEYPWGSARYLFKKKSEYGQVRLMSELTLREQRAMFLTRIELPGNWMIDENGMISPLSFLDFQRVESYFKSPIRYSYFLAKKQEGIVEQEFVKSQKIFIPDKELRVIARKLVKDHYGECRMEDLDVKSRLVIARRLRYDYASTHKQIARLLRLDKSALEDFI